jgi:hypothetical protein
MTRITLCNLGGPHKKAQFINKAKLKPKHIGNHDKTIMLVITYHDHLIITPTIHN